MTDIIVQIVFGWPAIITSILLSVAGILLKRPPLLAIAALIGIPFALYLTGSRLPGLLLPVFQFGSAYAVKHQKTLMAWLLIVPMIIAAVMLAYVVLTQ